MVFVGFRYILHPDRGSRGPGWGWVPRSARTRLYFPEVYPSSARHATHDISSRWIAARVSRRLVDSRRPWSHVGPDSNVPRGATRSRVCGRDRAIRPRDGIIANRGVTRGHAISHAAAFEVRSIRRGARARATGILLLSLGFSTRSRESTSGRIRIASDDPTWRYIAERQYPYATHVPRRDHGAVLPGDARGRCGTPRRTQCLSLAARERERENVLSFPSSRRRGRCSREARSRRVLRTSDHLRFASRILALSAAPDR